MFLFSSEKPCQMEQLDRILLSGIYNVRKGKTQLHKWAERLVILCGTCLIVSSVKDSHAGKMHILPLVGGKVRLFFKASCNVERKKGVTVMGIIHTGFIQAVSAGAGRIA